MIVGFAPVKVGHRQAIYIKPLKANALRGFCCPLTKEYLWLFLDASLALVRLAIASTNKTIQNISCRYKIILRF